MTTERPLSMQNVTLRKSFPSRSGCFPETFCLCVVRNVVGGREKKKEEINVFNLYKSTRRFTPRRYSVVSARSNFCFQSGPPRRYTGYTRCILFSCKWRSGEGAGGCSSGVRVNSARPKRCILFRDLRQWPDLDRPSLFMIPPTP